MEQSWCYSVPKPNHTWWHVHWFALEESFPVPCGHGCKTSLPHMFVLCMIIYVHIIQYPEDLFFAHHIRITIQGWQTYRPTMPGCLFTNLASTDKYWEHPLVCHHFPYDFLFFSWGCPLTLGQTHTHEYDISTWSHIYLDTSAYIYIYTYIHTHTAIIRKLIIYYCYYYDHYYYQYFVTMCIYIYTYNISTYNLHINNHCTVMVIIIILLFYHIICCPTPLALSQSLSECKWRRSMLWNRNTDVLELEKWIGCRENLRENQVFPMKYGGFR